MHARPEIDARLINLIDKLAYGGDEKLMAAQTLLLRRLLRPRFSDQDWIYHRRH
jgi:hypothetical protein